MLNVLLITDISPVTAQHAWQISVFVCDAVTSQSNVSHDVWWHLLLASDHQNAIVRMSTRISADIDMPPCIG